MSTFFKKDLKYITSHIKEPYILENYKEKSKLNPNLGGKKFYPKELSREINKTASRQKRKLAKQKVGSLQKSTN